MTSDTTTRSDISISPPGTYGPDDDHWSVHGSFLELGWSNYDVQSGVKYYLTADGSDDQFTYDTEQGGFWMYARSEADALRVANAIRQTVGLPLVVDIGAAPEIRHTTLNTLVGISDNLSFDVALFAYRSTADSHVSEHDYLRGKADGLRMARSYVKDAIRDVDFQEA